MSPSTPRSHSARMSVKSLRAWSSSAPHAIRSGVPSRASMMSLPDSPKNASLPGAAGQCVVAGAAGQHVVAVAARERGRCPSPPAASTGCVTWLVDSVSLPPARSIEMLGAIGQRHRRVAAAAARRRWPGARPPPVAADYVVGPGLGDRDVVGLVHLMVGGDRQAGRGAVRGRAVLDRGHSCESSGGLDRVARDAQRLDRLVVGLPVVDAWPADPLIGGRRPRRDDLVEAWARRRGVAGDDVVHRAVGRDDHVCGIVVIERELEHLERRGMGPRRGGMRRAVRRYRPRVVGECCGGRRERRGEEQYERWGGTHPTDYRGGPRTLTIGDRP